MRCLRAVMVLVLSLCAAARAGESWVKLADAPADPGGREYRPGHLGAWCYVPDLKGFILYGGRSPAFNNAMWLFDPAKKEWKQLKDDDTLTQEPLPAWQKAAANEAFPGGRKWRTRRPEEAKWSEDRPGAGDSHGVCYDPDAKVLWFLGGFQYAAGGGFGLWKYTPAGNAFAKTEAPPGAPRQGPLRLAYDRERRLVVCVPVLPDQKEAGGTYNPAANAWKAIPGPEAKVYDAYPAMAYDAGAKLTVYFAMRGDKESATWVFDGAAWKDAKPEKQPPARKHPGMCYAPEAGGVVLVGGVGRQDTWKYDAKANAWEEIPATGLPQPTKPKWGETAGGPIHGGAAYYCDALAYDQESKSAVLFDATIGVWALKLGNGK